MELRNNGFLCFEGTYDYYLEKRDALLKLHEEKQAAVLKSAVRSMEGTPQQERNNPKMKKQIFQE